MTSRTRKQNEFDDLFSGQTSEKVDPEVLSFMLEPYSSDCRYLQEAFFYNKDDLGIAGKFSIPHSFYVASTGHFNAVEFVICFDQLYYVFFGEAVRRGLFPKMELDSLEDCRKALLSDRCTKEFKDIRFKTQINPKSFSGCFFIRDRKKDEKSEAWLIDSKFKDSTGGKATGQVTVCFRIE